MNNYPVTPSDLNLASIYELKKDGILVDSMSLNGQLVVSRIAKTMIDGRLKSFGKAYLTLMKSDAPME